MPVANVIRVSLQGGFPNGEVWSINPVWQIGGVSTAEDITADQCLAIATAIDAIAIPTSIISANATSVSFTGNRVEARRWDGTLSAQAEHTRAPQNGTGNSNIHPFQTALVLSLRTSGVGASARGRLFLPATGVAAQSTNLRPATATVTSILSGMKTWLTSITSAIDVTTGNAPVLSVWSRKNAATLPVTGLQMGDILDVQRRRRDAVSENYSALSFP